MLRNREDGFIRNGDDGSLIEHQLFRRAGVKRKSHPCPAKNRFANLAPVRFRRYFNDNDSRFIASEVIAIGA